MINDNPKIIALKYSNKYLINIIIHLNQMLKQSLRFLFRWNSISLRVKFPFCNEKPTINEKLTINNNECKEIEQIPNKKDNEITSIDSKYVKYPIEDYQVGQRLDRFLKNSFIGWSSAQKHLRSKNILVQQSNGQIVKQPHYKLNTGDQLLFKKGKGIENVFFDKKQPQQMNLSQEEIRKVIQKMTIFDNKNILVINKPAGYSIQGGDELETNLFSLLALRYKREYIHIVHRLDRPTTGITLFPKNLKTAQLIQAVTEKRVNYSKFYLAMTEGKQINDTYGHIRCNVEWVGNKHKAKISEGMANSQDSKDSITFYNKILEEKQSSTSSEQIFRNIFALKLMTGRKHQIRCHLSEYLQNPIVNDRLYGGKSIIQQQQKDYIYLHAFSTKIYDAEIAETIFQVKLKSNSIISSNAAGNITYENGQIKIIANLPDFWDKHKNLLNQKNLEQISLETERRQMTAQTKKKLLKKVLTIS